MVGAVYAARAGFMDELLASQSAAAGIRVEDARAQVLTAGVLGAALMPLVMLLAAVLQAGGNARRRALIVSGRVLGRGARVHPRRHRRPDRGCLHAFHGDREGRPQSRVHRRAGAAPLPLESPQADRPLLDLVLRPPRCRRRAGLRSSRGRARAATVAFAIAYVLIMSWSGPGAVGPGM